MIKIVAVSSGKGQDIKLSHLHDTIRDMIFDSEKAIQGFLFEKQFFTFFQNNYNFVLQCCHAGNGDGNPRAVTLLIENIGMLSPYTNRLVTGVLYELRPLHPTIDA